MTALVETYFDESEEGEILCVSGYLFKKESAAKLSREWNEVLKPHGIKRFHMVDCAHGVREFSHLKDKKHVRVQIQTDLSEILKRRMEWGYSVAFDLRFSHLLPSGLSLGIRIISPYALCCYFCLMFARHWATNKHYKGKIAYFFEAGHKSASEADRIMRAIFKEPTLKGFYKYGGHAFLPKEDAVPLQCADILAWQWRKYLSDLTTQRKTKPRADLYSLLEKQHFTLIFDEARIRELISVVARTNEKVKARKAAEAIAADAIRRGITSAS